MYLHIGNDFVVLYRDLIGIFDIENTSVSKTTQKFLYAAEKAGKVRYVSMDIPKSFIVTNDTIYISPISASTLKKRTLTGGGGEAPAGETRTAVAAERVRGKAAPDGPGFARHPL